MFVSFAIMQNSSIFRFINVSFFTNDNRQICLLCKLYQVNCFKSFPVYFSICIRIKLLTIQAI